MIKDAPSLGFGLEPLWEAFQRLTSERQVSGWGPPGRVPWTAIDRYAARFGWGGDQYLYFLEIMEQLDRAYLDYQAERFEAEKREQELARGKPGGVQP